MNSWTVDNDDMIQNIYNHEHNDYDIDVEVDDYNDDWSKCMTVHIAL